MRHTFHILSSWREKVYARKGKIASSPSMRMSAEEEEEEEEEFFNHYKNDLKRHAHSSTLLKVVTLSLYGA